MLTKQNTDKSSTAEANDYQAGQIFIKVRRRISMPKVLISTDEVLLSPQKTINQKYSKDQKINILADLLVADCTENPINPNAMGSIGQADAIVNPDKLPPELNEFSEKLRAKKSPASHHLMYEIFSEEVKASESWKKSFAVNQQFIRSSDALNSLNVNDDSLSYPDGTLETIAENFVFFLFKNPATLESLGMPEDFKKLLCIADQKFVAKLLEQDGRAARGEAGAYALSKKLI